jgi:hypothetical protein
MAKKLYSSTSDGNLFEEATGKKLIVGDYKVVSGKGSHGTNNLLIATVNGKELTIARKTIDEEEFSFGAMKPPVKLEKNAQGGASSKKERKTKVPRKARAELADNGDLKVVDNGVLLIRVNGEVAAYLPLKRGDTVRAAWEAPLSVIPKGGE